MSKKLRYLPLALKIVFVGVTAGILYHYRDTLYRFCQFPIPFIMCPVCPYPCFFRAARLQEIIAMGVTMSGLVVGRVFCGFVCPVGTVQDWLQSFKRRVVSLFHYLMRRVFPSKGSASKGSASKVGKSPGTLGRGLRLLKILERRLRLLKYPFLLLVVLYALARYALEFDFMPDWGLVPALTFTLELSRLAGPGHIYFVLLFPLVIALGVGLIWHRPWCKYLCPFGLLFAVFNKISFLRIKLTRKGCTECRECLEDCTTGQPLSKLEKGFDSIECIRSYSCVLACPEGEVKLKPRSAR